MQTRIQNPVKHKIRERGSDWQGWQGSEYTFYLR